MIENVAYALMIGFWVLAAFVVLLRLGFPKAPLTGKVIEYLANVTVSRRDTTSTTATNRHTAFHAS